MAAGIFNMSRTLCVCDVLCRSFLRFKHVRLFHSSDVHGILVGIYVETAENIRIGTFQ